MRWNVKRQTGFLYLYEALLSFRMIDAVWVIFLLDRGYSLAQVGLAEGVMHMTSLICEIPTGMAADLFGRKRTLIFAGIAGMCSGILMGLDGWSGWIYVGMMFSALSYNLASGTQEALVYDSLVEAGRENRYRKVWSGINVTGRISRAAGSYLSGRYSMTIRKTVLVCGLAGGIGTFLAGTSMIPVVLLGACAVQISEGFSFIVISENVNRDFTSDQRATLVSVDSMMYSLLMVAASPVTGSLGSRYGAASPFYLLGGMLAAGAAAYGMIIFKKR